MQLFVCLSEMFTGRLGSLLGLLRFCEMYGEVKGKHLIVMSDIFRPQTKVPSATGSVSGSGHCFSISDQSVTTYDGLCSEWSYLHISLCVIPYAQGHNDWPRNKQSIISVKMIFFECVCSDQCLKFVSFWEVFLVGVNEYMYSIMSKFIDSVCRLKSPQRTLGILRSILVSWQVRIGGLQQRPDLNGKIGTVVCYVPEALRSRISDLAQRMPCWFHLWIWNRKLPYQQIYVLFPSLFYVRMEAMIQIVTVR